MMFSGSQLPLNWKVARISEVAEVNPKLDKRSINDDLEVSFVSMPSVEAETGVIDVSNTRRFAEVKKGYTGFMEGDVLFAKITPCMENGKMALVPALKNNLGFGSTEFHVFRVGQNLEKKFLYYYVSSKQVRFDAEHNMTGAVGQKRVPTSYISDYQILVPPLEQQKLIVTKIEELFSELDSGIASLKTAREQLKIYRQALLKHAFEGKLTEQWRKDNADKLETPEQLLARIQTERETRYQQQLNDWKQAVKEWEVKGKEGKRPSKPAKPSKLQSIANAVDLPWCSVNYEGVCELIRNGISEKPVGDRGAKIFRISAVRAMSFDLSDIRYIKNEDGQYNDFFLKKGDLVFTRYNGTREYVGVCAEYKGDESHLYPDKLILTRLGVQSILPSFLEKAFATGISRNFIEEKIRTTAGQSGISGGDIKSTPIPICSLAEQQEIVNQLEEKLSIIEQSEKEIETALAKAELLRQSILKKAFSGKLIIKN